MTAPPSPIPRAALIYGLLGLIPFLAPPVIAAADPSFRPLCGEVLALYGALILSFLGGARWGLAVAGPRPDARTLTLSMLPTLAALALLLAPASARRLQLPGLAIALVLHAVWDVGGRDPPPWYSRLRVPLTAAAAIGLCAGAVVAGG